eukprot:gene29673-38802_t
MPTKDLSPHERLAMQAGAVMQLQIADASESEIRVKLKSNDIESSTSNIPATPKRYKEPSFLLEDESLDELISSTAGSAPRSSNQPTNKKEKIQKTKMAKISSAPPVPGNLLNQLKTGRPLKGVVVSCTPYAAFVSTKVFRASRGGTYTEVNGMLHKNDISQEILDSQKRKLASMGNKVKGSQPDFLEKGTQLNVYVKEVFKNSGRFTLTTDSTIVKSKVLEIKEQTKTLSKERRHNRRLRRQLESIVAGDTVSGTVLKVTREGILVSISSLGSLNVTGIISKADLPKQYEVPPDLRESFQNQLLQQDFSVGRGITCAVSKVNPTPSAENLFNVKLLFEEFSTIAPTDDFEINDIGDLDGDDDEEDDEEEEEEEEEAEEDDLTEIYNELKGEKAMLVVEDLLDWEDIQEMIEEGVLTQDVVLKSVKSVVKTLHAKNPLQTSINLTAFKKIVNILEEDLDRLLEDDDDDEEDSESGVVPGIPEKSKQITMSAAAKSPPNKKVEEVAVEEEEEEGDNDDDDVDDDSESIFEMLKNKNNKVPVDALLSWGEIKEVIDSKELTLEEFNGFVREVSNLAADSKKKPTELSKQQFMDLVDLLANKMNGDDINEEQLTEIYNDLKGKDKELSIKKFRDWDEVRDLLSENLVTEETLNATIEEVCGLKIGQVKTIDASQFISIVSEIEEAMELSVIEMLDAADEKEMEQEVEEEDEDHVLDDELLRESFEELRGKNKIVTIKAFKEMDDIKDMLESEYLTPTELDSIIDTAFGKVGTAKLVKTEVDYSKFVKMIEEIDKLAGVNDEEFEEDYEDEESGNAEIFDELKDKSGKMPLKTFFAWDSVMDILSEGLITKEKLDELIDEVCGVQGAAKKSSTKLDLEQFDALNNKLMKELDSKDDIIDVEASQVSDTTADDEADGDEFNDDEDDEETKKILAMVYDELIDKDGKLSLKSFLNWGDLKEMVEGKIITIEEVKEIVAEICGKKASNSLIITKDHDEEATEEIFNELSKDPKKEKIAMKDFLAWDEIRDLLKNDLIDMETLRILVTEVGAKMNGDLSKKQFASLLQLVDETTAAMTTDSGDEDDSKDTDALIKNYSEMEDDDEDGEDITAEVLKKRSNKQVVDEVEDEDSDDTDGEDDDEIDEETVRELYNALKGSAKSLSVKKFKEWEDVKDLVDAGLLSDSTLSLLVTEVVGKNKDISFNQFWELVKVIDQAAEISSNEKGDQGNDNDDDDDDEEGDEEEPTEEEIEQMTKEIFDSLKSKKTGKVATNTFKKWESIRSEVENGLLTDEDIDSTLEEVLGANLKSGMDYSQFKKVMDILEDIMGKSESPKSNSKDKASPVQTFSPGQGFGRPPTPPPTKGKKAAGKKMSAEDKAMSLSKDLYDSLKGKSATLKADTLRKWDELEEMVSSGSLKQSTIERALYKVTNSGQSSTLDLNQFMAFIDEIQGNVKYEEIDIDSVVEDSEGVAADQQKDTKSSNRDNSKKTVKVVEPATLTLGLQSSKNSQVLKVSSSGSISSDNDNDNDDSDGELSLEADDSDYEDPEKGVRVVNVAFAGDELDGEVLSEEDTAREIYRELKGVAPYLSLSTFLQWEDVRQMLEFGAITEDNLTQAIQSMGIQVDDDTALSFDEFFDLIQVIDHFVDSSKVPAFDLDSGSLEMPKKTKDSSKKAIVVADSDLEDDDEDEDGDDNSTYISDDEEVPQHIAKFDPMLVDEGCPPGPHNYDTEVKDDRTKWHTVKQ